jgi:hypothetical protein
MKTINDIMLVIIIGVTGFRQNYIDHFHGYGSPFPPKTKKVRFLSPSKKVWKPLILIFKQY